MKKLIILALLLMPVSSYAQGMHTIQDLLEALMPSSCPDGMVLVAAPNTEVSFCIEANERSSTSYYNAVITCANLGRHVCTKDQWWKGSATNGVNNMCSHNWEWTGTMDYAGTGGHHQVVSGAAECTRMSWAWTDQHNNGEGNQVYRCCKGGFSSIFK